jgi:hypothetical protein
VEEFYGTKVDPFPFLVWGVIFHCLRTFFFASTGWHWQHKYKGM